VVSTTIGAEGLRYAAGKDILIADEPEKFADACIRLLSEAPFRRSVAAEALDRAQRELSWAAVSREFEAILESNRIQ
jgi:polysaccharide biosynthesis protein PslH